MKFSKSSLILLTLGVMIIGAIMAGMIWSQQAQQKKNLEKSLSEAQIKLSQIKIDDLMIKNAQLTQDKTLYTAKIGAAKDQLTAPFDNIAALDILLESAQEFDLRVLNINSNSKSTNTLAGNKFSVLPFTLQVEGNISKIAGFVSNIKEIFPTSVVETYQLNITPPLPTPTPTPNTAPTTTPAPTPSIVATPTPSATIVLPVNDTISAP